jgi:hypothetical protein
MTPSDYEKFQQKVFDELDFQEDAAKQVEEEETMRLLIRRVSQDAKDVGINFELETRKGIAIEEIMDRIYGRLPWTGRSATERPANLHLLDPDSK